MKPPSVYHPTDRPNFCVVEINNRNFWFSYSTCIAFQGNDGLVITQNDWGTTTGKHLNYVHPDHSIRVPDEEFQRQLEELN